MDTLRCCDAAWQHDRHGLGTKPGNAKLAAQNMLIPQPTRIILAYLGAVAAATLAFVIPWYTLRVMLPLGMSLFRPDYLELMTEFTLVVAPVTAVAALAPCLLAERLAGETNIRSAWYYALWGAITGLALGPPVFALYPNFSTSASPSPEFWTDRFAAHLLSDGAFFALGGAVGGGAYRWIKGRCRITEASSRLS